MNCRENSLQVNTVENSTSAFFFVSNKTGEIPWVVLGEWVWAQGLVQMERYGLVDFVIVHCKPATDCESSAAFHRTLHSA